MSWDDIIRRVLPPINGVQPHVTGPAGRFGAGEAEGRQYPSSIPHGGVDFNYIGGKTSRLNQSNPVLRSPIDGVVVNAGQGTVGRIAIRDKNGFIHEILHTSTQHVTNGDPVVAGQIIGAMGKTGTKENHVHYQLRDKAGKLVNPTEFWDQQGPSDPNPGPPSFLDQSRHAAEILSGLDEKSPLNGAPPPDRPGSPFFNPFGQTTPAPVTAAPTSTPASPTPFIDRYIKFGSVPRPNVPAASDDSASFNDRFGNWASSPAGALGNGGALAPRLPDQGKRTEIPDSVMSSVAQAASRVLPFLTADANSLGDVLKYGWSNGAQAPLPPADPNVPRASPEATTSRDNVPERRLVGRVVNLSAPSSDTPPLIPNEPAASAANVSAESPPPLGIFSGQPMPDWPVRPSIFQPKDQSSPDDNELFQRWMRWVDAD